MFLSIPLSISEGYGQYQKRDRARFYDIARGSAHESGAILDICNELNLIEYSRYAECKNLIYKIVCMLVKLSQHERTN
ncbi:MAG: four helix bundle protein [Halobacteriovoraceae bacterium]|nr:four helix bundle protein [Halobacteriovoraceae bacterium]MCB9093833.1 four helix bundle protein [Halobacteriovoraceae bacterium]